MKKLLLAAVSLSFLASAPAESLWTSKRNNESGMFADRLATNIGDILLVRVDEKTVLSRSVTKSVSSSTNVQSNISSFFFPPSASDFGKHNGALPSVNIKPNDSFSGEGSTSDSNIMQAKAAVLVVDVQENGNLVIEGAKRITTTGETQYVILHGIVRRDDVMKDNSVYSYNIVNASLETMGEGDLIKNQRQGYFKQLLDTLNVL